MTFTTGDALKLVRELCGLTRKQASSELGFAERTIFRWEKGSIPLPLHQKWVSSWAKRRLREAGIIVSEDNTEGLPSWLLSTETEEGDSF